MKDEKERKILMVEANIMNDISKFQKLGLSRDDIKKSINKCYISNEINKSKVIFESYEEFQGAMKKIEWRANQKIDNIFYMKYNTDEYEKPVINKIDVDSDYKLKKYGNAVVASFDEYEKIAGKPINVKGSCPTEGSTLISKFIKDKLANTCILPKEEEKE